MLRSQQLHRSMIYIIVFPDVHGQKVDTENDQIAAPPGAKPL